MEQNGVVSPGSGAKPREVYVDSFDASSSSSRPTQSVNHGFVAPVYTTSEPSYQPAKKNETPRSEEEESSEEHESRWPKSVPPPSAPLPKVENEEEEER
jgi:hypothetical protein